MSRLAVTMMFSTALFVAAPALADPIVLTFEGVGDEAAVDNFYNGGTDSQGHSGPNYGIAFSGPTLGLIDADDGGHGNFANEPSPNTIMFFLDADNAIMNDAAGFTSGFSFYYTSSVDATVSVWSGLDGTGTLLGSIDIAAQFADNCTGDPTGAFCNFTPVGVSFNGVAESINFGGTAGVTGYDNITFGSATPGNPDVPEPATWAMMIGGFGLIGGTLRASRQSVRFAA